MNKEPCDIRICATGSYVPDEIIDSSQVAAELSVDADWIVRRTGIRFRRRAAESETAGTFAQAACRKALDNSGVNPEKIGLLILATSTPDQPLPATACEVAFRLGLDRAQAFDLSSSCSGFINALSCARALLVCGPANYALVVGSEVRSRCTNPLDPDTASLYGDGAGAVLLTSEETHGGKILALSAGSDGSAADLIGIKAGGSRLPASAETVKNNLHTVTMKGRALFRRAVRGIPEEIEACARLCELTPKDFDLIIPHQMNLRIIEAVAKRLNLGLEKFFINVENYGNTSAASIPLALDEAVREGKINPGNKVCLAAFGGGLAWGTAALEWD